MWLRLAGGVGSLRQIDSFHGRPVARVGLDRKKEPPGHAVFRLV